MPTSKGDNFSGNFNAPVVTGGRIEGNVTSSGSMQVSVANQVAADLLGLLAELRAQVQAAQPNLPKAEVVLDNLDELQTDIRARQEGGPVEPAVAHSRWKKVQSLLSGATQITANLAQIGQSVAAVFGLG